MTKSARNPLVLSVYVPSLILMFGYGMLIPILPLYSKTFSASYALIGVVLAADGVGRLVGALPAGGLLGRIGQRSAMVIGVSCVAVSTLMLFWARDVYEVIFYRFAAGIGGSVWNIACHAYLADATAVFHRGRALSIFGGIHRIGTFAGPAVGGALAKYFSLETPFLVYGALATAVVFIAVAKFESEASRGARQVRAGPLKPVLAIFKSHFRELATAGSGQLFAQTIRAGRHVVVPLYAADVIGLDVEAIGWIITISALVDMSLFYPAGHVMDRFGRKFAMVPCFLIQAVAMAAIPFTDSFTGLLLATSLMGMGNGIGAGSMMTLGADLAPGDSMGEFLGAWRLVGDTGHMGAPLVIGGIANLLGLSPATFAIAGFGLLAAGIFAFLVPETLTSRASPDGSPRPE
ncbi:MAG: MFS transporter [Gemmatimonadota bacterium]|nr:MFS transporter [Gemmatimonadota bacterium]